MSAPGKLLLMGDHAVVYGYSSLVTAVDQRIHASASLIDSADFQLEASDIHIKGYKKPIKDLGIGEIPKQAQFAEFAVRNFVERYPLPSGIRIETHAGFSSTFGFGSSSATTVAVLFALASITCTPLSQKQLFDIAYKTILDVQGVGSGFDVAAAIWGGTIVFVGGGKVIEPIKISSIPLIVGYTGVKADTAQLVTMVAEKRKAYPQKVDRIFQAIEKLVVEAKARILEGDWERVGRLMDFNQDYLRDLGVSSEKLESLVSAAKGAGAWGAKLSGAGGGDCMIALAAKDKCALVAEAIQKAGGQVMDVLPDAQGVRVETTDNQDELFIVVDESDTVVGYKTRFECHHNPTLIHRTVGVLLFDHAGRLLLQKRSMTKDMDPGLWGISSAGHVTKGQTDDEAVHRELSEELGIDVPLTFLKTCMVRDEKETERAAIYKGQSDGPFTLHPEEVDSVQYFDIRELRFDVVSRKIQLTKGAEVALKEAGILV